MTLKQFIQANANNLLLNRWQKSHKLNEITGEEYPVIKLSTKNGNKLCITISSSIREEMGDEPFDMNWLYNHVDEEVNVSEYNPLWCKIIKVGEKINLNEFKTAFEL